MTDNEIIKALQCCAVMYDCPDCPFECDCGNMGNLSTAAIDLINRLNERDKKNERIIELADKTIKTQSAEIEMLTVQKNAYALGMVDESEKFEKAQEENLKLFQKLHQIRAEAIRDVAEKLPELIPNFNGDTTMEAVERAIKHLVKEMVGDDNG